jgi:hypothetical protein
MLQIGTDFFSETTETLNINRIVAAHTGIRKYLTRKSNQYSKNFSAAPAGQKPAVRAAATSYRIISSYFTFGYMSVNWVGIGVDAAGIMGSNLNPS